MWAGSIYNLYDARDSSGQAGRPGPPEQLLTGVKPTVRDIGTVGCIVRVGVLDETSKTFESKAPSRILLL